MNEENVFRVILVYVFVSAFVISGYFRRKARQSGETISRKDEGDAAVFLRMGAGLTFFGSIVIYAVAPDHMSWASLELPGWLIMLYALIGAIIFRSVVIPKEEEWLIQPLGEDYQIYRGRTGAMVPRLSS